MSYHFMRRHSANGKYQIRYFIRLLQSSANVRYGANKIAITRPKISRKQNCVLNHYLNKTIPVCPKHVWT